MSYKDVLKVFKLERELTDDETALLNTLRDMTDAEREMTVEAFGGSMGKVGKGAVSRSLKKFKKCDVCGISKRAAHHRDVNHPDYHEFDAGGPRSACLYAIPSLNGKICGADINQPIHHDQVIKTYHEFQPSSKSKSARASSIAEKLPKPLGQGVKADEYGGFADDTDMQQCTAIIDDNGGHMTCGRTVDDNIHHRQTDPDYHEFQPSVAVAASGD